MRQQLAVACDMHLVAAARRVAGAARHRQAEVIAAVPLQVATGGGGVLDSFAARPVAEHGKIHAVSKFLPKLPAADGGGGAYADRGAGETDDGDEGELVHHGLSPQMDLLAVSNRRKCSRA